jgi:oxepin-CoA hydrolase/3-oxo-5,6-dehydrosuberyl-CoA semialdehyde dehydrogenase
MATMIRSFVHGEWVKGTDAPKELLDAATGETVYTVASGGFEPRAMLDHARTVGNPALRAMTIHQRALMIKALASYLDERKERLYEISRHTGATRADSWGDIDGGIITMFAFSSKARKEMPDQVVHVDGPMEILSRSGTFVGRHIAAPLMGTAVHINAFNFPVWGMLEKLAPTWLAGMPAIVKPATLTSYLTEAAVRSMLESKILPEGALQLVCGSVGDLFDHLTSQDVVTFTGSAETGKMLKSHPRILDEAVRFNMEADSLNCAILGPDAEPGTAEFDLFVKEVQREMTAKAGQKCTAIRRALIPANLVDAVAEALSKRLDRIPMGDPGRDDVRMGPLAGRPQTTEVASRVADLREETEVVYGGGDRFELLGGDREKGAFYPATVLHCDQPFRKLRPHGVEAFGPVVTLMPYKTVDEAVRLAALGKGSLVGSLFTLDDRIARDVAHGIAPYHGRLYILNRTSAPEATGHGAPLATLVHGGPGRAGGGEEMGGVRGVMHYLQRAAVQGSPQTLSAVTGEWMPGAARREDVAHPFSKHFEELAVGDSLTTHRRTVTEADIVNFAGISGDFFYAHMDDIAAKESLFGKRVAHGYFVLAAAAGLFVWPNPGPVLANYGLEDLRFLTPVYAGDTIQVTLTCQKKNAKAVREGDVPHGVVYWHVDVKNQKDELCASYTLLTLVARKDT